MADRQIKAGTTNVSVVIRIIDSSDGTPETGVVFDSAGIDMKYRREYAANVNIVEIDLTTPILTDAHEDGGFLHIGNGYYRLDLPDAACAAGVKSVIVHGVVTGMVVIGCEIELVTFDPYDTVRLGLTALPNAAADAAGGLPISDGGGLDLDAILGRITANVALASVCTEARLAELAAANMPADLDTLLGRVSAAVALASVCTEGRLAELDAANLPADIDTLLTRITAAVALASVCTEGRLAELDAANLPADIDTLLTRVTAAVALASVCTEGRLAELDAGNIPADLVTIAGLIAALENISTAQVNAEVVDVLKTDTSTLPGQEAPTATPTLEEAIMYVFKALRNKSTQSATTFSLFADDGSTVDQKATVSEAAGTVTKGELGTGP